MAWTAAEQNEDARLLGSNGLAAGIELVGPEDHSWYAQRKGA
jgi:hypothetical protein